MNDNERENHGSWTALLQPVQEPTCPKCKAGVLYECVACSSNNYPFKAQRKPLTNEEIMRHEWILSAEKRYEDYTMQESIVAVGAVEFARAIEAAHGIKEKP
jgi:hypothetical protein